MITIKEALCIDWAEQRPSNLVKYYEDDERLAEIQSSTAADNMTGLAQLLALGYEESRENIIFIVEDYLRLAWFPGVWNQVAPEVISIDVSLIQLDRLIEMMQRNLVQALELINVQYSNPESVVSSIEQNIKAIKDMHMYVTGFTKIREILAAQTE